MEGKIPLIGEMFPDMSVVTTHGVMKLPEAYAGKWWILFSHPGDFTPVCTTEFVGFQQRYDQFKALNTELIGLSIDQVFSHLKWTEWIEEKMGVTIQYPVIADGLGKVSEKLGLLHGQNATATVRAVFIIDPRGVIRAMVYYPAELGRNMDEVLRAVKALQVSDRMKVAMPANWPHNELIKDKVIIPPASNEKTAKERKVSGEGYDWWFKYKDLD